jgi:hypothetical protein
VKRLLIVMMLLVAGSASAQEIGLYAPTAPFDGPVARLDFISALAAHIGGKTGKAMTGRAYAKASDFNAAIHRGDLHFAVVDASYLSSMGVSYTVLAVAERNGSTQATWEVVTSAPAKSVLDLRGKTVIIPAVGAREDAFVNNVLLEGELPRDFFHITTAPDALSALAAVEHGRAEVAIVPSGLARPAGVHKVATLGQVSWPVLVALPGAGQSAADELAAAAGSFSGGAVFQRFARGGADPGHDLGERFSKVDRHAPMAVPQLHLAASTLLAGRKFSIARPEVTGYVAGK